jgi:hypothetical protein
MKLPKRLSEQRRNDLVARNSQVFERLPVRDIIICILNFSLLPYSCIFPFKTKKKIIVHNNPRSLLSYRVAEPHCFPLYIRLQRFQQLGYANPLMVAY